MTAQLMGWQWENPTAFVTLWDGTEVEVMPGDTVAGYMTVCGTLVAVHVFKKPPSESRYRN